MRLPPHDADAERAVLGAVLRDPDVLPAVLRVIGPEDLYWDAHQRAMRAVISLAAEGKPVDLVLVHDRLRTRNELADVGGPAYLAELWQAVPTGAGAAYHAEIVRECAVCRRLIHAANEVLRDALDRVCPADELVRQAVRLMEDAGGSAGAGPDVIPMPRLSTDRGRA